MKKKIVATMLALTMGCVAFTGCGSAEQTASNGKVVVYMPSPTALNEKYIQGFEAKTGIDVELFEGTTGEIQARLEAEKNNPIADVVVLASWADGLAMKEEDKLLSFEPENADKLSIHTLWFLSYQ